ncbi:hypothetical protein [Paenibacillus sp. FSL H8-0259]|uniref:hypothetical protein n=1 Tax=Paenibacillus sp. FSL H8-0259 TaxID=1920423 RepID=UPI00096F502D|nr:hypothetical protein [Paenibacillus sp. FSL H8-0259]OMF28706.1 hypothetical protein BK132_12005 [Paenibacillus sp. FSL H8-0259]
MEGEKGGEAKARGIEEKELAGGLRLEEGEKDEAERRGSEGLPRRAKLKVRVRAQVRDMTCWRIAWLPHRLLKL